MSYFSVAPGDELRSAIMVAWQNRLCTLSELHWVSNSRGLLLEASRCHEFSPIALSFGRALMDRRLPIHPIQLRFLLLTQSLLECGFRLGRYWRKQRARALNRGLV